MEQLYSPQRVIHGVQRYKFFLTCTAALPVAPFCLEFLNVGAVTQHDAAQVAGGKGADDLPPKTILEQQRQKPGMIDVCMGQQHIVNLTGRNRDLHVLKDILALFHTAVYQKPFSAGFHIMAAAGYLMIRPDKI